jgi:seryl-tRNA synthetase
MNSISNQLRIHPNSDQQTCGFHGDDLRRLEELDAKFSAMAKNLGAQEIYIPILVTNDTLEKCGYMASFPQQLIAATPIQKDEWESRATSGIVNGTRIDSASHFLTPAACVNIYPLLSLAGVRHNSLVTARTRVFRNEGTCANGVTRLWDFTVREIVAVGDSEFVSRITTTLADQACAIAKRISPKARVIDAEDPFYPTKQNTMKARIQKANRLKRELTVNIGNEDVALASFNLHNDHFSRAFNIGHAGITVTACAGFGLERWVAAERHCGRRTTNV